MTKVLSIYKGWIERRATMRCIVEDVAARYGFEVGDIVGPVRHDALAKARQEAMYALAAETDEFGRPRWSYLVIGDFLNRDHSTVIHGVGVHARRLGLPAPCRAANRRLGQRRKVAA